MTKIKIEIEIDVDFQKFFDDIPEGLFKNSDDDNKVDRYYKLDAVHKVLRDAYTYQLENRMNWMTNDDMKDQYEYAKHHLLIDAEIGKQISENSKVEIIKE